MNVHYGDYKDFNDLALHLAFNYNKYKPTRDLGKDAKLQYKDAIHILVIFSYNQGSPVLVQRGRPQGTPSGSGNVIPRNCPVLWQPILWWKDTNKQCCWFDDALAAKNGAGNKDRMTELLTVEEGIFGRFFMDTDILLLLYYDIHNQQRPIGDMPCRAQHTMAASWKKAINKFVEEPVIL